MPEVSPAARASRRDSQSEPQPIKLASSMLWRVPVRFDHVPRPTGSSCLASLRSPISRRQAQRREAALNGPSLIEGAEILSRVCAAIDDQNIADASSILTNEYPFEPLANVGRLYSALQCMLVFARDGFIDRYSGRRLVFPGTLRLLSRILPLEFLFHNNWKTDACHFAFYELFPTIDHLVPVSRGGADNESNWVSTSMIRNAAKSNFTVEELGWQTAPPGSLREWLA